MLSKVNCLAYVVVVLLASCGSAKADLLAVTNPSFESPDVSSDPWISNSVEGWTVGYSGGVIYNGVYGAEITNAHGNQFGWIRSDAAWSTNYGSLHQNLAATYTPGKSYTLTVGVAYEGNQYAPAPEDQMRIQLTWNNGSGDQVIQYQAIVLGDLSCTSLTDYSVTVPTVQASDPFAGQQIGISLAASYQVAGSYNLSWNVDNVRLTAVPEPSTVVLLYSALTGLLAYAWRKRR